MLGDFDFNLQPQVALNGVVSLPLYSGCIYDGHQKTPSKSHVVKVQIQNVDMKNQFICGYLTISDFNPSNLTTYFEGEFISESHPFLTNKWGADRNIDVEHWKKFPYLKNREDILHSDFDYNYIRNSDFIFMRWKEKSAVIAKDQDPNDIKEGNFAGFYYISLSKSQCTIEGYYYFRSSEKRHLIEEHDWMRRNQHLSLQLKKEQTSSVYMFC